MLTKKVSLRKDDHLPNLALGKPLVSPLNQFLLGFMSFFTGTLGLQSYLLTRWDIPGVGAMSGSSHTEPEELLEV